MFGDLLICYADDGLFFGSAKEIENLEDEKLGVKINKSKSGFFREKGIQQKSELKFLGLVTTIDKGSDDIITIRSRTRKGADLEFTKSASLLTYMEIE